MPDADNIGGFDVAFKKNRTITGPIGVT